MMIFWKAGLVFLSVPKTGTHAWAAVLDQHADIVLRHPQAMKHMPARRFRREILPVLDPDRDRNLSMVAVIRDPVDWLGSWYRYRSRAQLEGDAKSTAGLCFADFVAGYLSDAPPPWAALGSQARFVSNRQGKVIVKHLFAYERPDGLRRFLSDRLGADIPAPPRLNVSPDGDLSLPAGLRDRLHDRLAPDIALHQRLMTEPA
ncbi:gamma-glutamyl kinase [Actibacterium ureilyticum]|uniref:gamma-glutamyl kinase n=1 Tax=Actibacterium ureilyticum TaxID=1590614 RepID=UPI000BAADC06|nr:gamma-glutamyl kinase [Actibacterium ureilyticum]